MSRIVAFGDSITWGGNDSQGGWADRIKKQLLKSFIEGGQKWQLVNCGIGGNTSEDLIKRIEIEASARQRDKTIITIAIGINDSRLVGPERRPEVELDNFVNNMNKSIDIAKKYSDKVIIIGLTPVETGDLEYKNYIYNNQRIRQYNDRLSELAQKHNLQKIEVFDQLKTKNGDVLSFDGVHLNDAGHELMAKLVWEKLSPHLT